MPRQPGLGNGLAQRTGGSLMSEAAGHAKARAALVSVASNTALTGTKLAAGLVTHSVSVLSEALHSGLDLAAALMAFAAVRRARQPPDADHNFGHGKFESLSGLAEGALILVAVGLILWGAIRRLWVGQMEIVRPELGALVMGFSAVVNMFVSRMLFRVARKTESVALEADAWHLRTDVWTSAGVLAGMVLIGIGQRLGLLRTHIVDPIIAIGVAALIARAAWDVIRRSYDHLVDRSLPKEEVQRLVSLLEEHYPQFSGFHRLRTRRAGSQRYVDVHLVVPGDESVAASHALCDHLEQDLRRMVPGAEIMIHVEPEGQDG